MKKAAALLCFAGLAMTACFGLAEVGYSTTDPAQVTCGCHDGATCYEGASTLAAQSGETPETAEQLMYFAQCACFHGGMAGCNTLSHFAKDWTRACDRGDDDAKACTFAGFVYHHGVRVPQINGASFDRNEDLAAAAFGRACKAGSKVACDQVGAP